MSCTIIQLNDCMLFTPVIITLATHKDFLSHNSIRNILILKTKKLTGGRLSHNLLVVFVHFYFPFARRYLGNLYKTGELVAPNLFFGWFCAIPPEIDFIISQLSPKVNY